MFGINSLFDVFSLLYVFRSLQMGHTVWREWAGLLSEPLTSHKQQVAEQASFFISVPPGVLLHELGHALAIWLFGGRVVEFGYRVFWGYVIPQGTFTSTQDWFISLAGTLGSLLYGLGLWLLLKQHRSSTMRFFALRSFRFQVYFSLIYYPVMTLVLPIGDWRTVYNFSLTPILSSATAVFHAFLLFLFWQYDRAGTFEMPAHKNVETHQKFLALENQVKQGTAVTLTNLEHRLRYVRLLRQGNANKRAQSEIHKLLKIYPHSAEAYLELSALLLQNRPQNISQKVAQYAQQALQSGLSHPPQIAHAHQLLGQYSLDRGNPEKAISEFTLALETLDVYATSPDKPATDYLYYLRSLAYRRQQRYPEAYQDIQKAMTYAQEAGNEQVAAYYREQVSVLEKHAGRSLDVFQSPSS